MPQSEMLDLLILAGFRDATCFSLPELTSKEPDCKYTSGSLKIGFHQRIGVRNFTFGSFLLDTQILNVKKQLRLQKLCQTPIVFWVDGDHRVLLSLPLQTKQQTF
jgi:hypothetical protein